MEKKDTPTPIQRFILLDIRLLLAGLFLTNLLSLLLLLFQTYLILSEL